MAVTVDTVADEMFKMVVELKGKKNLMPTDLTKAMIAKYGDKECSRDTCKQAIRKLIDSGKCTYGNYGGYTCVIPAQA